MDRNVFIFESLIQHSSYFVFLMIIVFYNFRKYRLNAK